MDQIPLPLSGAEVFSAEGVRLLEQRILPQFIVKSRWFGGKARLPRSFSLQEWICLPGADPACCRLALIAVKYEDGTRETYSFPLELSSPGEETQRIQQEAPQAILVRCADGAALFDAVHGERFRTALLRLLAAGEALDTEAGQVAGIRGSAMPAEAADGMPSRVLKVEQSNSSLIYSEPAGEAGQAGVLFVKLFRKLEQGMNPDVEMIRFLAERRGFPHVPPFGGAVEYRRPHREPQVLALALGLVPNEGDAWSFALKEVRHFYERVLEAGIGGEAPEPLDLFGSEDPPAVLRKLIGDFYPRVEQLGQRTGEMHVALASDPEDPAFAPEPFTRDDQQALGSALQASITRVSQMLSEGTHGAPRLVSQFLAHREELLRSAEEIATHAIPAEKIRTHGDYHLGQVLNTGSDFVIIDFEGEPQRSLAERKAKRSPLRDVAGMLRSFHYAARSDLEEFPEDGEALEAWAEAWTAACSRAYVRAWSSATRGATFVPGGRPEMQRLLDAFLLEKAIYEVEYELNHRPAWLPIPLRGILRLLGTSEA